MKTQEIQSKYFLEIEGKGLPHTTTQNPLPFLVGLRMKPEPPNTACRSLMTRSTASSTSSALGLFSCRPTSLALCPVGLYQRDR